MADLTIVGNLRVTGQIVSEGIVSVGDGSFDQSAMKANSEFARTLMAQEPAAKFPIDLASLRVWDAFGTVLPETPAADDLGLVGGTFGTGSQSVQTGDLKAAGSTDRRARFMYVLPTEYESAQTVNIRLHAGMLTTVSDTSATVDVEVYESDEEAGIGSDLVTTAATTINSLTLADKDFVVDATSLVAGDILDIRITVNVNDAATGTAVTGIIGAIKFLLDIRG